MVTSARSISKRTWSQQSLADYAKETRKNYCRGAIQAIEPFRDAGTQDTNWEQTMKQVHNYFEECISDKKEKT
jgi:hypothetical protein